jgi:hypothetical protein
MRRKDIQQAFEAARALSNHHEFVVIGSLSVLGLLDAPPEAMSFSIDIDFYPLGDPGRATDIAEVLGENSEFHEQNGYYLDAVSPALPVLPDGWENRLVKVPLGETTAYFLDVHDTAVSKYARGAENDYRWLEAGYESKILNIETVSNRVRFDTVYLDDDDRRKTTNGLRMHRIAMQEDCSMAKGLIDYFHTNPPRQNINEVDADQGQYSGPILWADESFVVQSQGRGNIIIHAVGDWSTVPSINDVATVRYCAGRPTIQIENHEQDNGPTFGL